MHAFPNLFLNIVNEEIIVDVRRSSIEEFATKKNQFVFQRMFAERHIGAAKRRRSSDRDEMQRDEVYRREGGDWVGSSIVTVSVALLLLNSFVINSSIFS